MKWKILLAILSAILLSGCGKSDRTMTATIPNVQIITADGHIWEMENLECIVYFDTNKTENLTDDAIMSIRMK